MAHNKIYTGIGARDTPLEKLQIMRNIGYTLQKYHWTLRSGHADGADQAFEWGAKQAESPRTKLSMEIYLPWPHFENAPQNNPMYITPSRDCRDTYDEAMQVAERFHPAWNRCTEGAKSMHARNVYQIAGQDLNTPSGMVICWTKDGLRGGGTGQALRIAEYLKIPIFDLAIRTPGQILNYVNHGVIPS